MMMMPGAGAANLFLHLLMCASFCLSKSQHKSNSPEKNTDKYTPAASFSDGDFSARVYDDVAPLIKTTALASLVSLDSSGWHFAPSSDDEDVLRYSVDNGNLQWLYMLEPEFIATSIIGRLCRNIFRRLNSGASYFPREAFVTSLSRGAAPQLIEHNEDADQLYVMMFLSKNVSKNSLSQLTLYSKDGDHVLGSIASKFRRLVVFNGSIPFILKPPSIGSHTTNYALLVKWTTNRTEFNKGQTTYKSMKLKRSLVNSAPFPLLRDGPASHSTPPFQECLTDIFYDKYGNHLAVFDNVFSKAELDVLAKYVINYSGTRRHGAFIEDDYEDADNVEWISGFEPSGMLESKMWSVVYNMAVYLSGRTGWYPYDIALNTVQNFHHTRYHTDCMDGEFEYTFLLYLNPDWSPDTYGETAFTDVVHGTDETETRLQQFDIKGVILPKYGRIAMFRNIVNHSARPPSPDFHGSRYSFAVKVSINKRFANLKRLMEHLEAAVDGQVGYEMKEELDDGEYDNPKEGELPSFLEDTLANIAVDRDARHALILDGLRLQAS